MRWYHSTKTAKIFWVTLDVAMHGAAYGRPISTVSTVAPATLSLTEIWSLEFILILILLLPIGVTAVHFYSIRQKTSKFHTKIRLDLQANGLDCHCEMLNLKYPANYYTIDTGIHPAEFKINGRLFPRLYFEGAIKVTDPTGQPDFNNSISISYWKLRTLKRILRDIRHKRSCQSFCRSQLLCYVEKLYGHSICHER